MPNTDAAPLPPTQAVRMTRGDHPTVVVSRLVKPGCEAAFAAWAEGFGAAMASFPGAIDRQVIPPVEGAQREWTFMFAFDSTTSLRAWVESPLRREWLARAQDCVEHESTPRVVSGLEALFGILPPDVAPPPPVWKVAVSVLAGLYPTSLLSALYLTPQLESWPVPLRVLATGVVVVASMTWVVMPVVTRALRVWLYPAAPRR